MDFVYIVKLCRMTELMFGLVEFVTLYMKLSNR